MDPNSAPLADTAPSDSTPPSDNTPSANDATPPADSTPPPADSTPPANDFNIPEEYQKREIEGEEGKFENAWTDKVKSVDDLWKMTSELQKMAGKKNLTPDFANATPNEIEEYFNQVRPQSADEYNFNKAEGEERTEIENQFAEMLYENGVSKHQADKMIAQYQEMEEAQKLALYDADSFIKSMEEVLGNGYEAKATQIRHFLEGNMNEALKEKFQDIPNPYMVTVYEIAHNLMKAYGASEGSPNGGQGNMGSMPPNVDDQIDAVRKQIADLGKQPGHTMADKKALTDKLADLTKQKYNRS